jgi:uncharacterized protein YecT (DUF1311 family)
MLKAMLLPMLCGCVLLMDAPVEADEKLDCKNAQTQMDMNICAQKGFDTADKALNVQYLMTRKAAKARDTDNDGDADQQGAEQALIKGQRAWIAYRDAHCDAFAYQVHGGSLETEFGLECQADLTRKRTVELRRLEDGFRN